MGLDVWSRPSFSKGSPQVSDRLLTALGCVGSSAYISIHNMCSWMIDQYGTQEQQKRWLPAMTKFDLFSSYCLTEPDSGSDA